MQTQRYSANIFFIYTLFISFCVHHSSINIIRPIEFFIPILLLIVLTKLHMIKNIIIVFLITITYLYIVDIFNNGITGYLLSRGRYWIYLFLFIALAKIFVSINYNIYKKNIHKAILISILTILFIYTMLYLKIGIFLKYFAHYETHLIYMWEQGRIIGVPITVFILFLILSYQYSFKKKFNYYILLIALFMFIFMQSRTTLITIVGIYIILFFSKKAILKMSIIFIVLYPTLIAFLEGLMLNDKYRIIAYKLSELLYFWNSPSMFVRINDTKLFIINWLTDFSNFIVGHGLSFHLKHPRYQAIYDPSTGKLNVNYGVYETHIRHQADNLMSLLIVEGGVILLSTVVLFLIYLFFKIYKKDKRLGFTYLFIVLVYGVNSVHIITNYIVPFILAYIYYSSQNIKKEYNNQ